MDSISIEKNGFKAFSEAFKRGGIIFSGLVFLSFWVLSFFPGLLLGFSSCLVAFWLLWLPWLLWLLAFLASVASLP